MRALVCGGRDFEDHEFVFEKLDELNKRLTITLVIEGDARGADRYAGLWASSRKVHDIKFPANWDKDKKAAGPIRNQRMLDEGHPDIVIAFPGGEGTKDMIKRAKKAGVEVIEIQYERRLNANTFA